VNDEKDWIAISAGENHSLAVKSDGSLWAWGDNYFGQLGDGTLVNKNSPVKVESDVRWIVVNSKHNHNIAVKSDGTFWTWGWNGAGQLGVGGSKNSNIPVRVEF
jgi:alpha-tubulin suppressor-like RCC1 family protein